MRRPTRSSTDSGARGLGECRDRGGAWGADRVQYVADGHGGGDWAGLTAWIHEFRLAQETHMTSWNDSAKWQSYLSRERREGLITRKRASSRAKQLLGLFSMHTAAVMRQTVIPPSDSPLLRLCEAFAQGYERGGKPHSHHPWWPPTFHGRQRSRSRCLGARFPKLFVCEHLVREPVVHRLRPLCQWIGTSRSHWTKRQRWPSRSSAS